jgi:hypothetical protein
VTNELAPLWCVTVGRGTDCLEVAVQVPANGTKHWLSDLPLFAGSCRYVYNLLTRTWRNGAAVAGRFAAARRSFNSR